MHFFWGRSQNLRADGHAGRLIVGREAVRPEQGEVLASSGFLVLASMVGGFVQVGAPAKTYEDADFETCQKPCPTAAAVRTLPGSLATSDAGRGVGRGVGLAH